MDQLKIDRGNYQVAFKSDECFGLIYKVIGVCLHSEPNSIYSISEAIIKKDTLINSKYVRDDRINPAVVDIVENVLSERIYIIPMHILMTLTKEGYTQAPKCNW